MRHGGLHVRVLMAYLHTRFDADHTRFFSRLRENTDTSENTLRAHFS